MTEDGLSLEQGIGDTKKVGECEFDVQGKVDDQLG
jgi:hypothetical protein